MAREQAPREVALALLARREHSARELIAKLAARGCPPDEAAAAVAELAAERLQSDERFAESFIAGRKGRGYGSARIAAELRERGVAESLIRPLLEAEADDWRARAERERRKRFGAALPQDAAGRARQARFLQYRGFTSDQIRSVLKGESE